MYRALFYGFQVQTSYTYIYIYIYIYIYDYVGNGCIYYGAAGCGKTTKLLKLASKATDPIILSFTNKAIENNKRRISEELQDKCHTFDSYFGDYHGRDISSLEGKPIFIEVYSTTLSKWMTKIYQAFTKYGNTVYTFGEINQCDQKLIRG